jgi:ABC-type bacteriocin/lantibiotic exporter with double-glycine peptidase domain
VQPFLVPALLRQVHAQLYTTIDRDGVCLQGTDYTCGPAASVTALRILGIRAGEGELAVAMATSNLTGTDPDTLAVALSERYGPQGLSCRFRYFRNIQELREAGLVVAVVKFGFLVDHYVTVLQVTDEQVVIGDPVAGKRSFSHDQFSERWRSCGIVLKRSAQKKE